MITLVTVIRNAAPVLERCLSSVAEQGGAIGEHVVIDGGSSDGTVELLRRWNRHPITWISEPDRGISHAFNKGITRARGDIIGILNADDLYAPGAVARAAATLRDHPEAGFCFGHCLHTCAGQPDWLNRGNRHYAHRILNRMPDVNHPTMFIRRSVYEQIGGYDERWRYAMDYDLLLRMHHVGIRGMLIDAVQGTMSMGGVSDRRWWDACDEVRRISSLHGADPVTAWLRMWFYRTRGSTRRLLANSGALSVVTAIRQFNQIRTIDTTR